jgi:hypothetical protein
MSYPLYPKELGDVDDANSGTRFVDNHLLLRRRRRHNYGAASLRTNINIPCRALSLTTTGQRCLTLN